MKIRIPLVISEDGSMSAAFVRNKKGQELQDTGMLWDDVTRDERALLIHVEAVIDIAALFQHATIEGSVDLKGIE